MRSVLPPAVASVVLALTPGARAEEVPRDEYLGLLPLSTPSIVPQTAASESFRLFGDRTDPGYRDVDPVDGIDDRRYSVLMALAVRFAPYLVQNTSESPTNFEIYIENAQTFPLHVDTWDISGAELERIRADSIDIARIGERACGGSPGRNGASGIETTAGADGEDGAATEDCKLQALLDRYAPGATPEPGDARVRMRPELFDVLFFDFPGEGPKTWSVAYRPEYEKTPPERRRFFPHAFVHPFLRAVPGAAPGYELVLQYWFFYPSNDSGMNHEGDWEHLNVVISPRSLVEVPLPAEIVRAILSGEIPATDDAADPLVIRRLAYYFHHSVMTLDFSSPNVYAPRDEWKRNVKRRPRARVQENEIWKATRHLAYVDDEETVVNTHAFGYIGADNKGIDQLLAAPGGKNRNPHGTYPFPGRYNSVGPGGTNDQVSVSIDHRRYLADLKAGKESTGPSFRRGRVLGLADRDRLRIVPDWERVIELVRVEPRARREWSWLVLPVRWGYPAARSPFTGVLPHFDTGNLSVVGPSYSLGWNEAGAAPGFEPYQPHVLPSIFPLGLQDGFRNDLGFLNAVLALGSLPPLDFTWRIASYPFRRVFRRRDPVYYPEDGLPFRFVGVSSGMSIQKLDEDFTILAINERHFQPFLASLVEHLLQSGADSTTAAVASSTNLHRATGPFLQVPFYIGGHFTSENQVRNVRADLALGVDFTNISPYRYSAEIDLWEYTGSIRYSITSSRLQPFLKAGYGWVWYRLENVQANGIPFDPPESGWIKPRRVWPNAWHVGTGIEFVPWRRHGKILRGAELAFRVEYVRLMHQLDLDLSGIPLQDLGLVFPTLADVPTAERAVRHELLLGATVSF